MSITGIASDQNPWWERPQARSLPHLPTRRDLFSQLHSAIVAPGQNRAQILLGPRQVGKSTLLYQLIDALLDDGVPGANITFFDFSDDRLALRSLSPREVAELIPPGFDAKAPRYFFFDEITSAAAGWDRWLKQAVDASRRAEVHPSTRFILSSPSASLLRDASLESGQGRWDIHFLEGMTFSEYKRLAPGGQPEAARPYLETSGYPGQVLETDRASGRKRLREDIATRAILQDLLIHDVDVARVKALFIYLVQTSGSQWEARNRASDLGADPRSVSEWLRLLEQTGLITILPRWSSGKTGKPARASSELRLHPKVYASDHGLVLAFTAQSLQDPQTLGRVYETVVYRHLREVRDEGTEVAYFRADDTNEIDFVVSIDGNLVGIEVTSARTVDSGKVARLHAARERLQQLTSVLMVCRAGVDEKRPGIIPMQLFLDDPRAALKARAT